MYHEKITIGNLTSITSINCLKLNSTWMSQGIVRFFDYVCIVPFLTIPLEVILNRHTQIFW